MAGWIAIWNVDVSLKCIQIRTLRPPSDHVHQVEEVVMNMKRRGRSGRTDRERVEAARPQAALALGRDPDQRDAFVEPPSSDSPPLPTTSASASPPVRRSRDRRSVPR